MAFIWQIVYVALLGGIMKEIGINEHIAYGFSFVSFWALWIWWQKKKEQIKESKKTYSASLVDRTILETDTHRFSSYGVMRVDTNNIDDINSLIR